MKIVMPWPDKKLTTNAKRRKHWRIYNPAIKADRQRGYDETLAQTPYAAARKALKGNALIACQVTFYPPDRRRRDDDGMIAAFKHMRDGICDALQIDDVRLRPHYVIAEPEAPGRVEVVI